MSGQVFISTGEPASCAFDTYRWAFSCSNSDSLTWISVGGRLWSFPRRGDAIGLVGNMRMPKTVPHHSSGEGMRASFSTAGPSIASVFRLALLLSDVSMSSVEGERAIAAFGDGRFWSRIQ